MFKKNYKIRMRDVRVETMMAIIEAMNLKAKAPVKNGTFIEIGFKANKEELTKLSNLMDKYNIGKAYIYC